MIQKKLWMKFKNTHIEYDIPNEISFMELLKPVEVNIQYIVRVLQESEVHYLNLLACTLFTLQVLCPETERN